ncbi:unnamed protein product [Chrysoparadoxa australica]
MRRQTLGLGLLSIISLACAFRGQGGWHRTLSMASAARGVKRRRPSAANTGNEIMHAKRVDSGKKLDPATEVKQVVYEVGSDGLTRVKPYVFEFNAHVKKRWEGRGICDVFASEFLGLQRPYFVRAIKCGRITVNDQLVDVDFALGMQDVLKHKAHRHEPPVRACAEDIDIIADTPDFLVIDKPSTVPMHPCGPYRYNSILYMLAQRFPKYSLYITHRLDRLVSGVVLFAKTTEKAKEIAAEIQSQGAKKTYVSRVKGNFGDGFPAGCEWLGEADALPPLHWQRQDELRDAVRVSSPITIVNNATGLRVCNAEGKPSETVFVKGQYDAASDTTVVFCKPITGRTHQLRLHLSWLGHPIANDEMYGGEVYYRDRARQTEAKEAAAWVESALLHAEEAMADLDSAGQTQGEAESEEEFISRTCPHCYMESRDEFPEKLAASVGEGIWLHALRYEMECGSFESKIPQWARLEDNHQETTS